MLFLLCLPVKGFVCHSLFTCVNFTGGASLQIIVKACKVLLKFVLLELENKKELRQPLKVHVLSL